MNPDKTLETTYYLRTACLELTSKCNLRCTYCSVSQPDYRGMTMSDECIAAALTGLRAMKTNDVAINGHGETTTVGDWPKISSAIRKSGARVHLTSNFARPFSPGEFHELAMMASVVVSLDTDDPELLRKVRRSVSIHTLLENIRGLKDVAARLGVTCPPIVASCVVYTDNVMGLDRFVRFAVRNGFRGFGFCNLVEYADLPGAFNVDHVTTLPQEELAAARRKIIEAQGIAFSKGATCEIQSGLLDAMDRTLAGCGDDSQTTLGHQRRRFAPLGDGETRRCLDPWFFVMIQADGSVCPCCWHPPIGSLSDGPLEDILNGEAVVSLRRQLLTGSLGRHCRTCPARPILGVAEFNKVVQVQVPSGPFWAAVQRMGLSVRHSLRPLARLMRQLLSVASWAGTECGPDSRCAARAGEGVE